MYFFEVPSRVYFGPGSRLEVLPKLAERGWKRLGIVIDGALLSQPVFARFLDEDLSKAGLQAAVRFSSRSDKEPDYDYLDRAAEAFRGQGLDAVLGIGGGSAMDLAKGVAILAANPGRGLDYRGMDRVQKPGLPVVVFPTTAGTGSEVTRTASFTDLGEKRKLGINGRFVEAWAGVLDGELTLGCPPGPTAAAGLDALVHCVESFTANTSSPLAREMARAAFPKLFDNLPKAAARPDDVQARQELLLGAYLAGCAMWNAAGGGPASGISYPLGVLHGVPHGFAGGLLLPHVIDHNIAAGYRGYEPLRPGHLGEAFHALIEKISAPRGFGRWGVDEAAVPALVSATMEQRAANLGHNPVAFGQADVERVLRLVAGPAKVQAA